MSKNSVGPPSEVSESGFQGSDEDRISKLPPDVMSHILSHPPLREAVATSVLSKKWAYKWTLVYNIFIVDVDRTGRQLKRFDPTMSTDLFDKIYLHVQNVRKIQLILLLDYNPDGLKSWIISLLRQGVEVLDLVIIQDGFIIPSRLLDASTLRSLRLELNGFMVFAKNQFPCLTSLYLDDVEISNENGNADDTITFTLPVLDTLRLKGCTWSDVKFVEMFAPVLTNFYSETNNGASPCQTISIHTTRLALFQTCGGLQEKFLLAGSVIKAEMINVEEEERQRLSGLRLRNLLKNINSKLENLVLSAYLAQAILESTQGYPLPTFHKLQQLHICDDVDPPCNPEALILLLHLAPSLKLLILQLERWSDYNYDMIEHVPSCIVSSLEVVKLVISAKKPHFDLPKFLLKNGVKLVSFYYQSGPRGRDEIMEQLSAFPRASDHVRISSYDLRRSATSPVDVNCCA